MDLLLKALIAAVAVMVLVYLGYYAISHVSFGPQVSKAQAESLVLHDLQNANPSGIINITNVTTSQYAGSWHIIASVVLNATSTCPSYYIYSFDYPKYGFVYRVDNTYTSNCIIYGTTPGVAFPIGSYPVAITQSYLLNLSIVNRFISRYGLQNVMVHASYYPRLDFYGTNYTSTWLVNYTSTTAGQYVSVLLSQANGTALNTHGTI